MRNGFPPEAILAGGAVQGALPTQAQAFEQARALAQGSTVGIKHDQDKPMTHLLDAYALEQLALVLSFGAKKYAPNNWRKGLAVTRLIGAALRHLFALLRGETNDPETGLCHAAHAMCCCMFILWTLKYRPDMDDRTPDPQE